MSFPTDLSRAPGKTEKKEKNKTHREQGSGVEAGVDQRSQARQLADRQQQAVDPGLFPLPHGPQGEARRRGPGRIHQGE